MRGRAFRSGGERTFKALSMNGHFPRFCDVHGRGLLRQLDVDSGRPLRAK
jgi:hypothetical protein